LNPALTADNSGYTLMLHLGLWQIVPLNIRETLGAIPRALEEKNWRAE